MGALLGKAATALLGAGISNPSQAAATFTAFGRKMYVMSLSLIGLAWYTAWRREYGYQGFVIPGLAKGGKDQPSRLSELPALQPFKKVLNLTPREVTDVTDVTGPGGGTAAPVQGGNIGKLPGALGGGTVTILQAGRLAQSMGLRVSENPLFGGVTPGAHVSTSLHYSGRAIDVSAPMTAQGKALMAHYAQIMAENYGQHLAELFWRGQNWVIVKNGVRQSNFNFVDGHQDHVHVGI